MNHTAQLEAEVNKIVKPVFQRYVPSRKQYGDVMGIIFDEDTIIVGPMHKLDED